MLERIDRVAEEIARLTEVIEQLLAPYEEQLQQAESMPGWGRRAAQDAVAETGVDMTRFRTGGHLSSWAGKTPLDNQSGKRTGRAKSKKGNRYLAAITGETAAAVSKTQTREGARYRRLARRRGKAKALVATGNTQLKVYHKLLSNPGMRYQDLGADYYERQRDIRRQISHHVGKLGALGFEVTLCRRPEPRSRRDRHHPGRLTIPHPRRPRQVRASRGPLPPAQLRSYFRVSNDRSRWRRTPADERGPRTADQDKDAKA
jgi:transposase